MQKTRGAYRTPCAANRRKQEMMHRSPGLTILCGRPGPEHQSGVSGGRAPAPNSPLLGLGLLPRPRFIPSTAFAWPSRPVPPALRRRLRSLVDLGGFCPSGGAPQSEVRAVCSLLLALLVPVLHFFADFLTTIHPFQIRHV